MNSLKQSWLCCICIMTLSSCVQLVAGKAKYVTVSLDAKWQQTPLSSEASEYLAKESTDLFWQYVEHVTSLEEAQVFGKSLKEHYDVITSTAEKYLAAQQMRLFHFAMSIRAYSPAVEMHNQLARDSPIPECTAFYDVHGVRSCDLKYLDTSIKEGKNKPSGVRLDTDHVYPYTGATAAPPSDTGAGAGTAGTAHDGAPTVILYGEIGRDSFRLLHKMLTFYAERGKIQYIIRHFAKSQSNEKVRLSGYGVELAIKSQEYKAQDDTKIQDDKKDAAEDEGPDEVQGFLFSTLKNLHPDKIDDLKTFRDHLQDSTNKIENLKVWQLQDLSFQAARKILEASREQQLRTLREISQNFPLLAGQLIKTKPSSEMRVEIRNNQMNLERRYGLQAGDSALYLNGIRLDLDIHDAFSLVDTLSAEVKLLDGLASLGLRGHQLQQVLKIDVKEDDSSYALDIRDKSIMYVNDLEKDRRYQSWPRHLEDLLKPTFPGMLRHMARNLFHLVFVVDPAEKVSVELLRMAEAFFVHNAPIRIGLLLVVDDQETVDGTTDMGVALYRGFQYISAKSGHGKGLSFLTDVFDRTQTQGWNVDTVKLVLSETLSKQKIEDVLGPDSQFDKGRVESVDYFVRTGLKTMPQVLMNGQPLKAEDLAQETFEEAVVGSIMKATPDLQIAVHNGKLTDSMSVLDWMMKQPNVMPRLNQRVFTTKSKYLSYAGKPAGTKLSNSVEFTKLPVRKMILDLTDQQKYLSKNEEALVRPITMSVLADFGTKKGRVLLLNALKYLKTSNQVRLGVIHNPDMTSHSAQATFWSRLVQASIETIPMNLAKQFLIKLLKSESANELAKGEVALSEFEVHGMDLAQLEKTMKDLSASFLISSSAFCRSALDLKTGQRAVLVNGRLIGPFDDDEVFSVDDFGVLEKHSMKTVAERVEDAVSHMDYEEDQSSDLVMKICAQIMGNPQSGSVRKTLTGLDDVHSAIRILPDQKSSPFEITAVLDPLTRDAQRIAPLLMVLQELLDAKVTVYMNCKEKLSEMPLKNFYRYVLEPRLEFIAGAVQGPVARFSELPHALLLTMNVDPPQGWLVEATRTPYDLDNIRLQEISSGVTAWYELENLLLEGHCFDNTAGGAPPRGLQFTLGTNSTPVMVDTIVMANLGYFQLKANPGAWILRLREGKSKEIFDISSITHDLLDFPTSSDDVIIVMDSFKSKIISVKVAKKPDKMSQDVLDSGKDNDAGGGFWDTLSSSFGSLPNTESDEKDETLNIFSVASGHLYERFLRIMTMGVLKHTKSKVKFWFLKNYLSPSFKESIPILAKHYGFEYELIQYKWPRWLHQQTEKQRIIWGYKILFLDVLFPLSVKKIIFVDADQIVRADLQELYDLDLEGAPYGYTPFCDSRKEMEGFRFWKTGYWASHLGHRKYHISALYVVDLVKFRRIAAGDRLRGQYQGLSQDPNSLSNLDQDLPNNMIHQVAMKSLPMEWLWCETWCSNAEKKNAKTIDMCNNPQTKEPKLTAARRIAPEWTEYDEEIKRVLEKKYKSLKLDDPPPSKDPAPGSHPQDTVREEL